MATEKTVPVHSQDPREYLASLFSLEGKTAVVIGGTGVLGGAICDAFAAAGAHVVVAGRNADAGAAVASRWPGRCEFFAADSTNRDELAKLVTHLEENGRRCDILLNGAGTNSPTPFLDITDDEWDRIMNINLRSVRLACQVFGKYMLDNGTRGSIINIASVSAELPLSRVFTYSASKAAVLNLTRNLAREWATQGIRVNAVSPGFFPAEQNRKVLTPERVENIMRHTPMARFGSPQELAGAMILLACETGGSFITGCNLAVDGGFTAMTI